MIDKKKQGKRNRINGAIFEKRVRLDLESKGWIVSKWQNNVSDSPEDNINILPEKRQDKKLVLTKKKDIKLHWKQGYIK